MGPDDDTEDEDERKNEQKQSQEQEQRREQKQRLKPEKETVNQKIGKTENDQENEYKEEGVEDVGNEDEGEEDSATFTNTESADDVLVPDVLPEGAWFIPLGWAHQCPPKFYKGSDPEWQSFIAFASDRQKSLLIRSAWLRKILNVCLWLTYS